MVNDDAQWMLVDIGNQRCKIVLADPTGFAPAAVQRVDGVSRLDSLWPVAGRRCHWWVSSVHRGRTAELRQWIELHRPADALTILTHTMFPLAVDVDHADRVGTDRLAAAAGASAGFSRGNVVVVDIGTAVTVDWVSRADGATVFHGGAILAGPRLTAEALCERTDALPNVEPPSAPVPAVGRDTQAAIQAGLYWGLVGAVRELAQRMERATKETCRICVTGGGGEPLAKELGGNVRYAPHLVLTGVHCAAVHQAGARDVAQRRR